MQNKRIRRIPYSVIILTILIGSTAIFAQEQSRDESGAYGGAAFPLPLSIELNGGKIQTGLWADAGLPTYSEIGVYRQSFEVTTEQAARRTLLDLGQVLVAAEVIVNGHSAGVRLARPFQFDLTDLIKTGTNQLEVRVANTIAPHYTVTNQVQNLGPTDSGLIGPVTLRQELPLDEWKSWADSQIMEMLKQPIAPTNELEPDQQEWEKQPGWTPLRLAMEKRPNAKRLSQLPTSKGPRNQSVGPVMARTQLADISGVRLEWIVGRKTHGDETAPFPLWDETKSLPLADDIPALQGVTFRVIKKWDQKRDGYTFLHGVGLGSHKGKLYASIGHNKGAENTVSEEAQYRVSSDNGRTWSELRVIDAGDEADLAVSHGVFLSHKGTLWAFHGAYYNKMDRIHTRAYSLDEQNGRWIKHGVVIRNGFWPMNQPVQMDDGNWIMPGISAGPYSNNRAFPAAVAISHGNDFTHWDYVEIPTAKGIDRMWGESAIWMDGKRVFNVARYGGSPVALAAASDDYGRTWSASRVSNLSMATSKPAAGTLSTGQRYLICTTARNNGGKRTPLTIAVSRPGENTFSRVFVIRRSRHPDQAGESAETLSLAYPSAVEHDGKLYVGFSNNGGRRGNLNSAELAIIPIEQLGMYSDWRT